MSIDASLFGGACIRHAGFSSARYLMQASEWQTLDNAPTLNLLDTVPPIRLHQLPCVLASSSDSSQSPTVLANDIE